MLENLIFSINSVLPIFIVIVIGKILSVKKIINTQIISAMNKMVFKLALPIMLFEDVYSSNFKEIFEPKLILYAYITTLIIYFSVWLLCSLFMKNKKKIGAFVQGCYRGNFAIIGLSVVYSILGEADLGKGAVITAFIVPLYNVLAVIVLTFNSGDENLDMSLAIKNALKNIIKNPLIIALAIGIFFACFEIKLPDFAVSSIEMLSKMAMPLALLAIGGTIEFSAIKANFKLCTLAALIKLVIAPLIFIPIAYMLGFVGQELVVLFVMYATPTAVSSFIMADAMGSDKHLASNIILMTTMFSAFSFTIGIFTLKALNII